MSKDKILTESVMASYSVNQELGNFLSDYAKEKCLDKKGVRILDWRHGRWRTVYLLREGGYDAYGH